MNGQTASGRAIRAAGFTLIELMITVAVMAILVSIANASYQAQIRKANRAEAMDALSRAAMAQERYLFAYGRYATSLDADVTDNGLALATSTRKDASDNAYYDLTLATSANRLTYTLTATPQGSFQQSDSCGALTLAHDGTRGAAKPNCW